MTPRVLVRAGLAALLFTPLVFAQTTSVSGAGGTFIYPLASKWFHEYNVINPHIQINYQSIGSGGGIRQFSVERTVDFGETDGPMNDQQLAEAKIKPIYHLPLALGGVVPIYNLPVNGIRFSGETLANIYLGKVGMWNDPAIAKDNPGVKLPSEPINVVHRADGSGTTYTWVDFLSKVSSEFQKKIGVGTSVTWPLGLGGKGNEGVAGLVRQTPGAIGYVELIYALQNKIAYAPVKNTTGAFVNATLESVSAAAATAHIPADYRVSITNPPGKASYPISTFTWILASPSIPDPAKKKAVHDFLVWALTKGQSYSKDLGYAPLPKALIDRELKDLAKLK
ncbi:MAG: phosphate ABC transporter substrate-binding protein PstS [Holophaga sp.]|nr:phosphate ABC transporter substrate-binding protein PstS [Holophaga sp.]